MIRTDAGFADAYARTDLDRYRATVTGMARLLFGPGTPCRVPNRKICSGWTYRR